MPNSNKEEKLSMVKTESQEKESESRMFISKKPDLIEYLGSYVLENGVIPSTDTIAQQTKIHKSTIRRHMNLTVEEWSKIFNKRTGRILSACAEKAEKGDVNAMRLFFEIIEKFSDLKDLQNKAANKGAVFNIQFQNMQTEGESKQTISIDPNAKKPDLSDA